MRLTVVGMCLILFIWGFYKNKDEKNEEMVDKNLLVSGQTKLAGNILTDEDIGKSVTEISNEKHVTKETVKVDFKLEVAAKMTQIVNLKHFNNNENAIQRSSERGELKVENKSGEDKYADMYSRLDDIDVRATRTRRSDDSSFNINCTSPLLSCKDRCLNERDAGGTEKLRCSCDPYCDYFKDCCADYVKYCLGERSKNTKTDMKVPDEQWTCRSVIWMIASCPKGWTNQDVNNSCITTRSMTPDNYKDVLPVVTPDNKTYANRFCAQCHGYNANQIKMYELHFECVVPPPSQAAQQEKMKFLFDFCETPSFKPGDLKQRRYCYYSEARCSDRSVSRDIQNKCLNGRYALVYHMVIKMTFKNLYCGKCNRMAFDVLECGPGEGIIALADRSTKPFSVIMDIGDQSSTRDKKSEILSCPTGNEVYDVYLETCRSGQQFVPVPSNLKKYRVALWLKALRRYPPFMLIFNEKDFVEYFSKSMMINSTTVTSVKVTLVEPFQSIYLVQFDLDITNYKSNSSKTKAESIQIKSTVFSLLQIIKPYIFVIRFFLFVIIKSTLKPLTCVDASTYSPEDYKVLPGRMASLYINKTGEMLGVRDYFSNNMTIVDGKQVPVGDIVVCRQMLSSNCSGMYIFLQKHEYVIFPNRSVFYNASGHLYEYGTYMWKNGTIMICTNFTTTYKQSHSNINNDDKVLTILTYIGFSISVLCLLFVLVTYSLFVDLRTIPGINLMNLSSALLIAQLLWLVGSGLTFTRLGCTVIAIVLHYSFLASFSWMSIIAFNTWRGFSGNASLPNRRNRVQRRKRIFRMMAVGWLPLVIYLIICVALDKSGTVVIGYGGDKGCWINNSWANLYFFAIPVAISILWNAVFFVLIVKAIRMVREQSQMAASKHHARRDLTVYARIAVLMGFTWVFGFMVPFTSYYLTYPFVILNTLQGLYIAIAFGFTRRVRAMYKNIFMKKNNSNLSHSQKNLNEDTLDTKF